VVRQEACHTRLTRAGRLPREGQPDGGWSARPTADDLLYFGRSTCYVRLVRRHRCQQPGGEHRGSPDDDSRAPLRDRMAAARRKNWREGYRPTAAAGPAVLKARRAVRATGEPQTTRRPQRRFGAYSRRQDLLPLTSRIRVVASTILTRVGGDNRASDPARSVLLRGVWSRRRAEMRHALPEIGRPVPSSLLLHERRGAAARRRLRSNSRHGPKRGGTTCASEAARNLTVAFTTACVREGREQIRAVDAVKQPRSCRAAEYTQSGGIAPAEVQLPRSGRAARRRSSRRPHHDDMAIVNSGDPLRVRGVRLRQWQLRQSR